MSEEQRDDKPERQVLIDAIGRMLRLHEGHTFDVLAKRIADEVLSLRSAVAHSDCPDCGGTGSTPISTCLRCGGTGSLQSATPTLRLMTQCSRHQGVPITIRSTLQTAVFYCPQCEEESAATDSRSAK